MDDNRVLKGVDAALFLLDQVKLLPTICLEHSIQDEYVKAYAKIEKQMNKGKNNKIPYFNDLINAKFKNVDGVNSLFDFSSGSIKIPMYEWFSILDNNALKQLWLTSDDLPLNYAMYDNENILLRGPLTYYYFLSQRYHDEKTNDDITTKEMVYEWLNNNLNFFSRALAVVNSKCDFNEKNSKPKICWGRYYLDGDKYLIDISLLVNHAFQDGYHMGLFFNKLQQNIYDLKIDKSLVKVREI